MRLELDIRIAVPLFLALAAAPAVRSQVPGLPSANPPAAAKPAEDPFGRDTPRGAVVNFLKIAERGDFSRAVQYLNLRPSAEATELARQLQIILDFGHTVELETISRDPAGDLKDGLPPDRERVGTIDTGAIKLDILLERVQRNGNPPVWMFSTATLKRVPHVFEKIDAKSIERLVPQALRGIVVFGMQLSRLLGTIIGLVMVWLFVTLGSWALFPVLRLLIRRLTREQNDHRLNAVLAPLRLILFAVGFLVLAKFSATALGRQFWIKSALGMAVAGVGWLAIRISNIVSDLAIRRLNRQQLAGKIAVVAMLHRLFKIAAVVLAVVAIIYLAGGDLTTILAGVGLGGIAIAFAAQKTLENLFGGVSLITDESIRVGDFCRFGDKVGVVEDIGLRSTRVRTPDRTMLSIPNGQLSVMNLENFSFRDKFLLNQKIGLRYETTPEQLRRVLTEIQELLRSHPDVDQDDARVRLTEFGASAFIVEIVVYVMAPDYPAFLASQEELLLEILDIIVAAGTSLAFPSQTTYVTRDRPKSSTFIEQAAERIEQRHKAFAAASPVMSTDGTTQRTSP